MGVVGVDSVVVEGWSSCFLVGLVLVVGQGLYFGELVLAPVGLPGDFYGIVGQFCFWIQPSRLPTFSRLRSLPLRTVGTSWGVTATSNFRSCGSTLCSGCAAYEPSVMALSAATCCA